MIDVAKMQGILRFTTKGIGGLHDTFRVVKRKRADIYKQPVVGARDIIDTTMSNTKPHSVRKRKVTQSKQKSSNKKGSMSRKRASSNPRQKSKNPRKGRTPIRKKSTTPDRRFKNEWLNFSL